MGKAKVDFSKVEIGQKFFDPYSGSYYTKVDGYVAECHCNRNNDYGHYADFYEYELVVIETDD